MFSLRNIRQLIFACRCLVFYVRVLSADLVTVELINSLINISQRSYIVMVKNLLDA